MRNILTFVLCLNIQFFFGQSDSFENRPKEPLFQNGGLDNFYNYLTKNLDYDKISNEKDIIIGFVIDKKGKMNHIKVGFCKNPTLESQIKTLLENSEKWDVSNQRDKNYFICFKMKLLFEDKQIRGISKIMWKKEDVLDVAMDINDFNNYGVTNQNKLNVIDTNNVYSFAGVEVQPEFPGGINAFAEYLNKNYKLPNIKGLKGRVFVEFVIEKDGKIADVVVIRHLGYGTGEEAIRVLNNCPIWKPGMLNGQEVRVKYMLPIMIDVQ